MNLNGQKHIVENKDIITGNIISKLVIFPSGILFCTAIDTHASMINKIKQAGIPTSHPKYFIKITEPDIDNNNQVKNNIIPLKKATILLYSYMFIFLLLQRSFIKC